MAITIKAVRHELQVDASILDDAAIQYAIDKLASADLNLVCAQVLSMLLSKNRGRTKLKIGKYEEWVDVKSIASLMRSYKANSSSGGIDDGFTHPDPYFTRDGI